LNPSYVSERIAKWNAESLAKRDALYDEIVAVVTRVLEHETLCRSDLRQRSEPTISFASMMGVDDNDDDDDDDEDDEDEGSSPSSAVSDSGYRNSRSGGHRGGRPGIPSLPSVTSMPQIRIMPREGGLGQSERGRGGGNQRGGRGGRGGRGINNDNTMNRPQSATIMQRGGRGRGGQSAQPQLQQQQQQQQQSQQRGGGNQRGRGRGGRGGGGRGNIDPEAEAIIDRLFGDDDDTSPLNRPQSAPPTSSVTGRGGRGGQRGGKRGGGRGGPQTLLKDDVAAAHTVIFGDGSTSSSIHIQPSSVSTTISPSTPPSNDMKQQPKRERKKPVPAKRPSAPVPAAAAASATTSTPSPLTSSSSSSSSRSSGVDALMAFANEFQASLPPVPSTVPYVPKRHGGAGAPSTTNTIRSGGGGAPTLMSPAQFGYVAPSTPSVGLLAVPGPIFTGQPQHTPQHATNANAGASVGLLAMPGPMSTVGAHPYRT
jgi:hypothetical protein